MGPLPIKLVGLIRSVAFPSYDRVLVETVNLYFRLSEERLFVILKLSDYQK